MKVRPLGNRVLVKVLDEEEKKSPGGIVLPATAKDDKPLRAEVLVIGDNEKIEVKPGDVVLVPRYGGTELKQDQEKLLIVKAPDILAVLKGKK